MDSFVVVDKGVRFAKIKPYLYHILQAINGRSRNLAVVFDIDATLLYYTNNECKGRLNTPIYKIYLECLKRNIKVFLVTARTTSGREYTENQLSCLGIFKYEFLFMRPAKYKTWSEISAFKAEARKIIRNSRLNILLNFGDQWSDIVQNTERELTKLDDFSSNDFVLVAPVKEDTQWAVKLPAEK